MPNREMLVNYVPGEECRIAIIEDGRLEELYQERASSEMHVGNIYKGRVINVEPSIQAAFIDFGLERNGFLHISDLHPKYFPGEDREETEQVGLKTPRRDRPPIQKCLRRGQEVLVQVLKEGIGTKGPTLTSYLSIPGRFLVMMPDMERMGVSRKVDDDDARRNMRAILDNLKPPKGFGFIIRTAGIGRNKHDLQRDLAYLQRLWKTLEKRMAITDIGELFAESDLIIRTMRDVYSADITRVIIDDPSAAQRARDFLSISNPRAGSNVLIYKDPIPIFHRFGIEEQIEHVNSRTVPLPSGGSLVIDTTEALVAIDVNSGKHRENRDAEMTAYKVNLEAVDEICRQLRLRDLGGVIVNDLIDMRDLKHRREIENRFRENLKHDRARTRIGQLSQFGVLEMTRQRMRPSHTKAIYHDCPACQGTGMSRSAESMVLTVIRHLSLVMQRPSISRVEVTVSPDVAFQLLNRKRSQLVAMEQQHNKTVTVRVFGDGGMSYLAIAGFDARGSTVDVQSPFLFGEPTLEAVPGLLDDSDLGDIIDEALIEETVPDENAATIDATVQPLEDIVESTANTADNMTESTAATAPTDAIETETSIPEFGTEEIEPLAEDDPLAAARSHYREGEEDVEAPDEQQSRPGFHGPRVVVPAPVAPTLITQAHPPVTPYRPSVRPNNNQRPYNPQQNQRPPYQQNGNDQGQGGGRRRRRRRGRGRGQGQQQFNQQGQPYQPQQQPPYTTIIPQDAAQEGVQDAEPLDSELESVDPIVEGDGVQPGDPALVEDHATMDDVAPANPSQPTDAELDELADSIGNLKSPELIELARRRLAAAGLGQHGLGQHGPANANPNQQQGDGEGRRRRRRRRRGRGGRGQYQQDGYANQPNQTDQPNQQSSDDAPFEPFTENPVDEDAGAVDASQIPAEPAQQPPVPEAEILGEPAVEVMPAGPADAALPEVSPEISQEAAPLETSVQLPPAKPARAPRRSRKIVREPAPETAPIDHAAPREPLREPVPDLVAQRMAALGLPPLEEIQSRASKTPPAREPAPETPAPAPLPEAPKPKRPLPLPPSTPLFSAPPEPPTAPAPSAPVVDPVAPVKSRSPITRPPYRRKKAAPETPKPEA